MEETAEESGPSTRTRSKSTTPANKRKTPVQIKTMRQVVESPDPDTAQHANSKIKRSKISSAKAEVDIPTSATSHRLTTWKLHQFDVDFSPSGITSTPAGNVVVCKQGSSTVRVYTPEGNILLDLQTPEGTEVYDAHSTDANIFVTDMKTGSVLVFDHQGHLITTERVADEFHIRGISVSNRKVYVTDSKDNKVLEMDLSDGNKLSTQRQIPAEVQLKLPVYIHSQGDDIAVSCSMDQCVYVLDSSGIVKYTLDTAPPGATRQVYLPWGVALDMEKRLIISNLRDTNLFVFSSEGRPLGHIDLTKYQLECPAGITIDTEGNLLAACKKMCSEKNRWCIAKFGYNFK